MPPKNPGGSTKFPGGHKVIHRTAQTAFVRVVTPRVFLVLPCFLSDILIGAGAREVAAQGLHELKHELVTGDKNSSRSLTLSTFYGSGIKEE